MNAGAIKERVLLITVAIVLAHMQEALEDNNLISIWEQFFCLEIISCSLSCFSLLWAGVIKYLSPFSPEKRTYYIIFSKNKALIKEAKETLKLANRELKKK